MKKIVALGITVFLTACAGNPVSYLPSGKTPIVNVEANIAERIAVDAQAEKLAIMNLTDHELNAVYKLFWYDIDGVTQVSDETWQSLWLMPKQQSQIPLSKPTDESANYRIYLRGSR